MSTTNSEENTAKRPLTKTLSSVLRGTGSPKSQLRTGTNESSSDFELPTELVRYARISSALNAASIDTKLLRELGWFGFPDDLRPNAWRVLLSYIPPSAQRQGTTLEVKRKEYRECVPQYFEVSETGRTNHQAQMLKQIQLDAPRTTPELPAFHTSKMQTSLIRVLYIWAIRHPASGYVQGINDLTVPFLLVFLSTVAPVSMDARECEAVEALSEDTLLDVEADAYWCVSNMLQGIQDHYTFAQPGIQRMVFKLKELASRLDGPLCKHLESQSIEFMHFSFRWMNCLLVRELPMRLLLRLWDAYLSEKDGFATLHVYVCAALLLRWSAHLQTLEFQELMTFLQNLPTGDWQEKDLEMLTAQAHVWRTLFEASPSHLTSS